MSDTRSGQQENCCDNPRRAFRVTSIGRGWARNRRRIYVRPGARSMAAANCTPARCISQGWRLSRRRRFSSRVCDAISDTNFLRRPRSAQARASRPEITWGIMWLRRAARIRSLSVRNFLPALVCATFCAWPRTFRSARNANSLNRIVTSASTSRSAISL